MSNDVDYIIVKTVIECWYEQTRAIRPDLAQPEQMLTVLKYLEKKKPSADFSVGELSPELFIDGRLNPATRTGTPMSDIIWSADAETLVLLPGKFKDIRNEIMYQRHIVRKANKKNPYAIVLHPKDFHNIVTSESQADLMFKPDGNLKFMGMKVVTHNAMDENKIKFAFSQGELDAFLQVLEDKGRM